MDPRNTLAGYRRFCIAVLKGRLAWSPVQLYGSAGENGTRIGDLHGSPRSPNSIEGVNLLIGRFLRSYHAHK